MLAVLITCMLVMSVTADLMTDKIPNALTVTGLTAGMLCAFARAGPMGLWIVIRDIIVMFFLTFLLFRMHAMRGGDGKLLCAMASLLGIHSGMKILLYSMIIAALMGTGILLWKKYKKQKKMGRTGIHFSVPIMLAALVCFLEYPF